MEKQKPHEWMYENPNPKPHKYKKKSLVSNDLV